MVIKKKKKRITLSLAFHTVVSNSVQILPPSGSTKTFQFSEGAHQSLTGKEQSAGFLDDYASSNKQDIFTAMRKGIGCLNKYVSAVQGSLQE